MNWPTVVMVAGIVTLSVTGMLLLRPDRKKREKTRIPLESLSRLWVKELRYEDGRACIPIEELAPIWREDKVAATPEPVLFGNERVRVFYSQHIAGITGPQRTVCTEILQLLEKEGDCSSVVDVSGDVEASWDRNSYTLLGRISLLDHSLFVAEEMVYLLQAADSRYMVPDGLVAALGHDLGKLPSIRGFLYSMGEHPLAAGKVLSDIPSFRDLQKREEVLRAIKLHHKRPEGLLGKTLRQADQVARQKELDKVQQQLPKVMPENKEKKRRSRISPQPVQLDMFGEVLPAEKPTVRKISHWFDAQGLLDGIAPRINQLENRRFTAFSTPDGFVFVQPAVLEEIARQQMESASVMDQVTMAPDDKGMREILLSMVHALREEGVIAEHLIKENYFGGYFDLTLKSGRILKGYYTPFHAEAFGSIAAMEARKTGILQDIILVEPHRGEDT